MIADPVVIPPKERSAYTEHVIYLPHTYQPTDDQRHIPETIHHPARISACRRRFVFCSFNNNYKIGPRGIRCLDCGSCTRADGVLWLLRVKSRSRGQSAP